MHQAIKPADCIVVLGCSDIRVADRASELLKQNMAPVAVVSGGNVNRTKEVFNISEAQRFANRMIELGADKTKILLEDKATNTGENILFSLELLTKMSLPHQNWILISKPYMERRSLATFEAQTRGLQAQVTSPSIPFEEYVDDTQTQEHFINTMVGDLQRIREYPKQGYMSEHKIPATVWYAYEALVKIGYDKRLLT